MRGTQAPAVRLTPAPVHWLTMPNGSAMGYQLDTEIIADCMLREGVGVAALAKRMGTSKGYAHDIVKGRRQPREDKVKALADALNVHPRALLLRVVIANSVGTGAEPVSEQSVSA